MKKILVLFAVLFSINSFSQEQKSTYKTYNFTELFKMIEAEKDSVFELKNAWIKFDSILDYKIHGAKGDHYLQTDIKFPRTDTIYISKELNFENVLFLGGPEDQSWGSTKVAVLHHIHFKKAVSFKNSLIRLSNNTFQGKVNVEFSEDLKKMYKNTAGEIWSYPFIINSNTLKKGIGLTSIPNNSPENLSFYLYIENNQIWTSTNWDVTSYIIIGSTYTVVINRNKFTGNGWITISAISTNSLEILNNDFSDINARISLAREKVIDQLLFSNNSFNKTVLFSVYKINQENIIGWDQFQEGIIDREIYNSYMRAFTRALSFDEVDEVFGSKTSYDTYFNTYLVENKLALKRQIKYLGRFYDHYKSQHDTENANAVYIEIKNLETNRLAYVHEKKPSFDTFFTLKINQFLNVFSAYGTKPSKAVIFSMYVILLFAFIYLLFPNSWDKHGKNRIINRYKFFTKYMKKDAGIHEVYLEDAQAELLEYEEFKSYMVTSGKSIPKFFLATSLPLYKWAISGTKFSSDILRRVDIMKGTWNDVPKKKRIWKSILLIGAFLIAICYDIFIKMLNALMLSINTFTTLGFGEIPIKGLPRYLAILQGFIGWFMLTIFSVSLISQLLN